MRGFQAFGAQDRGFESRFPILLVEDSPDDIFFVERAFKAAKLEHPLLTVPDGQQAIEYMSSAGQYADRRKFSLPRLVIADLRCRS